MIKELKFVQGAVAKKELLPSLTHFKIEDGTIRSFNGTLALCSPIELDLTATPKAIPFIKAIQNCKEDATTSMTVTPNGRLSIKSGPFKAFIECITEQETPHVTPEGEVFDINGEQLLKGIKKLAPFIGVDATRPWSNGILCYGETLTATNNIILGQYWTGSKFPAICNIPKQAIQEIIRIGQAPVKAQVSNNSLTLHYEDGKWIRTLLYDLNWPNVNAILDQPSNLKPLNPIFFEALEAIKSFTDDHGRVYFQDGSLCTTIDRENGASHDVPDFSYDGVYQHAMLTLLKGVAEKIDFSTYPGPALWTGDRCRGAIIGRKI